MGEQVISDHAEFIRALRTGACVCTTQEMYDHFLNVLPPVTMGSNHFTFKEGDDSIFFWRGLSGCFARIRSAMVADKGYDRYVLVKAQTFQAPYMVVDHYGVPEAMGKNFETLEDIAKAFDLIACRN